MGQAAFPLKEGETIESDNWIIQNLNSALSTWNERMTEIWTLITTAPEDFRGGSMWYVVLGINTALRAIAYALLVLFFVSGVMKTAGDFTSLKRPEGVFKIFLRFALAKAAITYSIHITTAFFQIAQGIVSTMIGSSGLTDTMPVELPERIAELIEDVGLLDSIPLWAVTLLGCLLIWALSTVIILTVYSRFFRLYIATAIAPIPLASFAGEPTSSIGKSFLKSYAGICLEGCLIVLCCIIFSSFATTSPVLSDESLAPVTIVWNYVGELLFNMLILVGLVKGSSQLVRELMGIG